MDFHRAINGFCADILKDRRKEAAEDNRRRKLAARTPKSSRKRRNNMNCDRCKKEIVAKMDKFTFAERTVCANCFDALWEEAGEAEMREEAERAALEAQSKLEAGW